MNETMRLALKVDASDLKAGFSAATKAVSMFQAGLGKVQSFASGVHDSLKRIGRSAAGFSASLAGAMVAAGTAAVGFEAKMRNVNSILYQSEEQLARTGDAIVGLSTRIPKSAEDLASGMYDIASSGFDGAEGLMILEQAGIAATAGMTDTATSAKAISGAINTWQLDVDQAGDVADILFKTVESGVVTFEELALQMSDFTGIAEAAGLELDEVSAAFAALTLSGMPASRAGTALSGVLNKLIKPTELLAETTKSLGYENGLAMVQSLGLKDTLLELSGAVDNDASALSRMFEDVEGLRGVLALTANDASLFENALSDIAVEANRAGAAQSAYAEQSKSVSNKIALFKGTVTALRIELGQYYLPILGAVLDKTTSFIGFIADAPEPVKQLMAGFMALGTVLSAMVALLLVSAVRSKLFQIALGNLKQGTKGYAVAQKVGIINAKSFTGALVGMAGAARRAATAANHGERSQKRWATATNRAAMATQAVSNKMVTLAVGSSKSSTSIANLTSRSSRLSVMFLGMSNRMGSLSSKMSAVSTKASQTGSKFGTLASRLRLAERAATTFGKATSFVSARMGMLTGAGFAVIDILQSWSATAKEARESAKMLREEVEEGLDTSSIQGMKDSYNELYEVLSERAGVEFSYEDKGLGAGLSTAASELLGVEVSLRDIKGGLENLSPFNDNNVQRSREEIIALTEELERMEAEYDRAVGVVDSFTSATNLSDSEAEALAKTLGVDLRDGTKLSVAELQRIKETKTPAEMRALADETGDVALVMLAAASGVEDNSFAVSGLGEQLRSLKSPIGEIINDTLELTEAQKNLKAASESIGSFGTALTEALQAERDAQQEVVDERLKSLEKANDNEIKALEDASEARIEAAEAAIDAKDLEGDALDAAQKELADLRDRETEQLSEQRDQKKEILDQQREDLQATVEEQKLSLVEMTTALVDQNAKLANWQKNLVTVTARTDKDVAGYLASMGMEGVELVEMMATGSTEEVEAMAEAIKENMRLTGDEAAVELDAGMTIAERAARLGAAATRDAVLDELGLLPGDAADIMRDYGMAIEGGLNAVLVGLGGDPVKFDFVTKKQGKSEDEVIPGGPQGFRVRASGGIDTPAHIARNPTVLFGERSTGGEAYIPLGKTHRDRSLRIWRDAGEILGVIPMEQGGILTARSAGSSGGGSTSIVSKNETKFMGDMYLSDAQAVLRYAERRKRMANLRGRGED